MSKAPSSVVSSQAEFRSVDAPDEYRENYQVDIGVFSGPLDLLLFLIKKEEVDISDIPIAKITRQYLKYIEMMQTLNLEVAGEFVLMAATLIRIKTRLLLPSFEAELDEGDPREELIWALMEYKKYREASEVLREKALLEEQHYVPPAPLGKIEGRVDLSPATTLFDLMAAYRNLMAGKKPEIFHEVVPEEISIEERMLLIMRYLKGEESALFEDLYIDHPKKMTAVVSFIAMLELARTRRVNLQQAFPFSALRVYRGEFYDAPHREIDLIAYEPIDEQVNEV
ncbi:MAG: segregation/condensation protein A [candidate division Zixibacteria bacterium]|nr:segregation/condensation protein A [candidate division Zixibacteria bacterium]